MKFLLFILFATLPCAHAADPINIETHDFSFEYGLAYHTLEGTQKSNNSKGRLTSPLYPYWQGSYAFRFSTNYAFRLYGGIQFVRFDEPKTGELKSENKVLNHHGFEFIRRLGPISKFSMFLMQQDHPLYFAKTPTQFEVVERSFAHAGLQFSLGQRRRIGLLWGLGAKGYLIFPTKGGNIATEAGYGGEAHARLGWVGPFGTLYQVKGFAQTTTAPNAEVTFVHEILGYCFQINKSF